MGIDFRRFDRLLARAEELVGRSDVNVSVKRVYEDKLAAEARLFRLSHAGLADIEVVAKKERAEGLAALAAVAQPYKQARLVTLQYIADLAVPKTLGVLSTETDKRNALVDMLEILDAHDDEPGWAADLTTGEFGRLAPIAIREIDEWILADGNLEKGVRTRASAYAVAYERFISWRALVRETYSPKSIHYRRLVVRSNGKLAVDDPVDAESDD